MIYHQQRATLGGLSEIQFQSRAETVCERLRQAILSGTLKPGDRLVEHKLAAQFGVGQPTLREALQKLEVQGFVRRRSTKGTYVTRLTDEDYRAILEVRLALETLAIERAAQKLTAAAGQELSRLVGAMEAAVRGFDLAAFHNNDLAFHRQIWDLAGNEYLATALERIAFGMFAFVLLDRAPEAKPEFLAAVAQHKQILKGLLSSDAEVARKAFLESTVRFWGEHHGVHVAGFCPVSSVSSAVALSHRGGGDGADSSPRPEPRP